MKISAVTITTRYCKRSKVRKAIKDLTRIANYDCNIGRVFLARHNREYDFCRRFSGFDRFALIIIGKTETEGEREVFLNTYQREGGK
jgi:hypothetical protein